MAGLCVLMLVPLLLLVSANATELYQRCCPEDEDHIFLRESKLCKSSRFSILSCEDEVNFLSQNSSYFWFIENGDSVVVAFENLDFVLEYDRFCVATVVDEVHTKSNKTLLQVAEGIIYCDTPGAQSYRVYIGPDPLIFAECILFSGVGCFLTFVVYILLPELRRDLLNKCLVNALFCYSVMYLLHGVTALKAHQLPRTFCAFQPLLSFFWITASIYWTYAISFEIWRSVVYKHFSFNETQLMMAYNLWGWMMPVVLFFVGFCAGDTRAIGLIDNCHINPVYALATYSQTTFILFFLALLYFFWIVFKLWKQNLSKKSNNEAAGFVRAQYKCFFYWKLFSVLSFPWIICGIATYIPGNSFTRIAVYMSSGLQGLLLFMLLVIFRKKVLLGVAEKLVNCSLHCQVISTNFAANLSDEEVGSNDYDRLSIKVQKISD